MSDTKTEAFVYPGLSEKDAQEMAAKQKAAIGYPRDMLISDRDPPMIKEQKQRKQKAHHKICCDEIEKGLVVADSVKTIGDIVLEKGKAVEVSVDHPLIGKLRTLKKLGVLKDRGPGRPPKGDDK